MKKVSEIAGIVWQVVLQVIGLINKEQALSAVRWVITTGGAIAVTKGVANSDQIIAALGLVTAIFPFVWSMFVHSDQGKIAAVAAMPEVKQVITTKAFADASPSPKVTNGFIVPEKK
jgi:hypothetical protein